MDSPSQAKQKFKILFLDFDGVLNSYRTVWAAPGGENGWDPDHLDPVSIGLVRRLCEFTGAKVVISSTWRHHFTIDQLKEILAKKGWPDAPIIGTTSIRISESFRGREVGDWMDEFVAAGNEVESWVILDDNNWFWTDPTTAPVSSYHHNQPLVKTDELDGFTLDNFYSALLILDMNNERLIALEYLLGYKP